MTPDQALAILVQVAEKFVGTRADHAAVQQKEKS